MRRRLLLKRSLQFGLLTIGLVTAIGTQHASTQSLTPLYRWFYAGNNDNFYTISSGSPGAGWQGPELMAYVYGSQASGTVPLNQYYNNTTGEHFYTIGSGPGAGWTYEGPACFVFSTQIVGTVPFFRWYYTPTGRHYYTTNSGCCGGAGWVYEGIEGYVSPPA